MDDHVETHVVIIAESEMGSLVDFSLEAVAELIP